MGFPNKQFIWKSCFKRFMRRRRVLKVLWKSICSPSGAVSQPQIFPVCPLHGGKAERSPRGMQLYWPALTECLRRLVTEQCPRSGRSSKRYLSPHTKTVTHHLLVKQWPHYVQICLQRNSQKSAWFYSQMSKQTYRNTELFENTNTTHTDTHRHFHT